VAQHRVPGLPVSHPRRPGDHWTNDLLKNMFLPG
jgi:hypothetical protein